MKKIVFSQIQEVPHGGRVILPVLDSSTSGGDIRVRKSSQGEDGGRNLSEDKTRSHNSLPAIIQTVTRFKQVRLSNCI